LKKRRALAPGVSKKLSVRKLAKIGTVVVAETLRKMEKVKKEFLGTMQLIHLPMHMLILLASGMVLVILGSLHVFMFEAMGDALLFDGPFDEVGRFATGAVASTLLLIATTPFHILTTAFWLTIMLSFWDLARGETVEEAS